MNEVMQEQGSIDQGASLSNPHLGWLPGLVHRVISGGEAWAIADQALVSAINFLTNVVVARYLGLTEFGVFALAWTAVLFFASMQMAGIVSPMMSLGPKTDHQDRGFYFGGVVVQELLFAVVSAVLLVCGSYVLEIVTHQAAIQELVWPLCVTVTAYVLQDFLRRYLFTTQQSRRGFLNDFVSYAPQLPVIYLLLRAHWIRTPGVLWIIAVSSLLGVVLGIYWFEPVSFSAKAFRQAVLRNWVLARWLAPSALLTWTSMNYFVLMAPVFYGALAAGALRATQNVVAVAHIWFLGLDNVLPAQTARVLHERGTRSSLQYLRRMTERWGGMTALFLGTLSLAPDWWLHLLYGSQYAGYGYILRYYCALYLFVFMGRVLGAGLQAMEFTAPIFWAYLIITVYALVAAIPLTKHFGLRGVLLGTISAHIIFELILLISLMKRSRRVGDGDSMARTEAFAIPQSDRPRTERDLFVDEAI